MLWKEQRASHFQTKISLKKEAANVEDEQLRYSQRQSLEMGSASIGAKSFWA
jgi:hypothetical protein